MELNIIAEIAQGFEGKIDQARLLVKAAADAGADVAKLQLVYADELATPGYEYYELFKNLEMPDKEWEGLVELSKELNIELSMDIFGSRSLALCERIGIEKIKLHGTDIANQGLLLQVKDSAISSVILGAGGSFRSEIIKALDILDGKKVILMLGFQGYPTEDKDNHLDRVRKMSNDLKNSYTNLEIGFGEHTDPETIQRFTVAATAIGAGATVIEKHITLGKCMQLEDHESALNPDEFKEFVQTLRTCALAFGNTSKEEDFGMSDSEKKYRVNIRRHVVASRDLPAGQVLSEKDVMLKRTGSENFLYDIESLYGKKLKNNVFQNQALQDNDR